MIICGDALKTMCSMEPLSVDAIVTDPPYGLSFMGKNWDHGIPGEAFWNAAFRVAKPGAHLLSFGGTRTFHRLTCAIEDAGWEIRDCLGWLYGSGFPKSLDVSKAIDKAAGATRERLSRNPNSRENCDKSNTLYKSGVVGKTDYITAPATEAARQWEGWGTALKPAWEPIVLARKPLDGTVAENVQKWGAGAINVDGCRIGFADDVDEHESKAKNQHGDFGAFRKDRENYSPSGRWPANIIHDGSGEVLALFPETMAGSRPARRNRGFWEAKPPQELEHEILPPGSAARFFYCAKASRSEREAGLGEIPTKPLHWSSGHQNPGSFQSPNTNKAAKNHHPTVKPVALMRYLCRLVTPPGGIVLDPFCGSGSTGIAAKMEGFEFIGIDRDSEYCEIAERRISGPLMMATESLPSE